MGVREKQLPAFLSEYLLRKAKPFVIYPDRDYTVTENLVDRLTRQFVEWRKTFRPDSRKSSLADLLNNRRVLDQLYARDLLSAVPDIVERTQELRDVTLAGISDAEALAYLREAANCYIHGLFQGTAALARSAVERSLRVRACTVFPKAAVEAAEFKELIDRFGVKFVSRDAVNLAHRVRIGGNQVLHAEASDKQTALTLLEDARTVLVALGKRNSEVQPGT